MLPRFSLPISAAAAAFASLWLAPFGSAREIEFNRDIRPILSNNCFHCHGPDDKKRDADLRLDSFEGATADLGGYAAVVPGKPDESELLLRVTEEAGDDLMPPAKSKKPPLTGEQVALLREWIAQGAKYEGHWAFLPIRKDPPPAIDDPWVRNGIDRFILARLRAEGIAPSPEAPREILLRRVYLDLTGLPPTPEELAAFLADPRPDAYERAVEALLENPHYGERWGRHWLDQARYADSDGYAIDGERQMWPYRDWVIRALNDDMPFDQFTIEQLAGDLLPNPTKAQRAATAFHRNTLINQEGGSDPEQFRVEALMDRTHTTGAVWLGLTVGCAQCHTHKFDPITQREYYQLYAFFNGSSDRNNRGEEIEVAEGELIGEANAPQLTEGERAKLFAAWEERERERLRQALGGSAPVRWEPASLAHADTASGSGFERESDGSLRVKRGYQKKEAYSLELRPAGNPVAAVRLRVLTDRSLPQQGPGTAGNGNFVLTDFSVRQGDAEIPIAAAWADHAQPGYPAEAMIDGDAQSGWAINVGKGSAKDAKMNAPHEATFVLARPADPAAGPLRLTMRHDLHDDYHVGRFAIDLSEHAPASPGGGSEALLAALEADPNKRTKAQREALDAAFAQAEPRARRQAPGAAKAKLMVMKELPKRRETYLFTRGDFTRPDQELGELQPAVFQAVAPAFPGGADATRLDLAKWLIAPENPLTARVTINRFWMRYFGIGIVETEEDFGTQGSFPTHPELLDWLARQFMENGWSMKAMHRLIATSAAYRQSSHERPELAEKDPRNLLIARQSRLRVDAEIVRDLALAASGLLDPTVGGPSVRPPQPDGVYAFTQNKKSWKAATGADRYRRGMYTMFFRSAPYPLFANFDTPDFQTTCTRRNRSNTPLQALNVANDPAFVEFFQGLALRMIRESDSLEGAIDRAFALALSRPPSEKERAILTGYAKEQARSFEGDPAAAEALLTPALKAENAKAAQAAALVCVARAILNSDNFITRE
ncbi:MAG: PSD1 and planctomycete cytochrome C domain-containing protein [Verrucomicrobiales bacterium]